MSSTNYFDEVSRGEQNAHDNTTQQVLQSLAIVDDNNLKNILLPQQSSHSDDSRNELFMLQDSTYAELLFDCNNEELFRSLEGESAFHQDSSSTKNFSEKEKTEDENKNIYTLNIMTSDFQHTNTNCIVEDDAFHENYHDKTALIPKEVNPITHPIVLFHLDKSHMITSYEDTGANKSYVNKKLIDKYRLHSLVNKSQARIQIANAEYMASGGSIQLSIAHGFDKVTYTFQIINIPMFDTIILGRDLLEVFNLLLTIAIPASKYADKLILQRISQQEIDLIKSEFLDPHICKDEDFMNDAEKAERKEYLSRLIIKINIY
jgi:hypothetical protein